MTAAAAAVGDTSAFVALEQERPLRQPIPEQLFVSIVTIAELRLGVLMASDDESQARRLRALTRAAGLDPLPIDEPVATAWAEMQAALRKGGRRLTKNDSWIAATALAHNLPVATQDDDYDGVPGLEVIKL